MEEKKLKSLQGEMRLLAEKDGWKQKVEIWLLNDITNRNDWRYERLDEHKRLFAETPILVAYVGNQIGDGHNFDVVTDENGEEKASFMSATAERIVGYFKSDSDIRIEERNGEKWIVGIGWIWQWYAQELVQKLREQGLEGMSVSIETLVDEMHYDGTTEVFTKYQILGTSILGSQTTPAVAGANIRALSALGVSEIRNMTLRVASEQQERQKNQIPNIKKHKENRPTMTIKNLNGKFVGFKVLAVDGDKVALLSDKGEAFIATATKDATGEIIEGVKTAVNGVVTLGDGENKMEFALDAVVDSTVAELTAQLEKLNSECETVKTALKSLQEQVALQRKDAVKKAIKARLAEINEYGNAVLTENDCTDLLADDKLAEFAEMVDKDGKFIGDERACEVVNARCGEKTLEANKAKLNSAKRVFAWQKDVATDNSASEKNDVKGLISKFTRTQTK